MKMIKLANEVNLSNCTLIIPAVAVGNVGQLAIDLLISNNCQNYKKIGHIITSSFIPIVGVDSYINNSVKLGTTCDIYHDSNNKLVAIQVRSIAVKKLDEFFLSLKQFIENHKISKVIILTSGWAHIRTDTQIHNETIRYIVSSNMPKGFIDKIVNVKSNELVVINHNNLNGSEEAAADVRFPLGCGFALKLFHFLNNYQIPIAVLVQFCSEGDNVPDAIELLKFLCELISYHISNIRIPNSWKFLFGKPPPTDLY